MSLRTIQGQPSWTLRSPVVHAALTQAGGHLGPVRFRLGNRWVEPFSVAPWAEEKLGSDMPQIIKSLRGDFFCMPFGGNSTAYRGEKHPVHGETANAQWKLESTTATGLQLSLRPKVRKGLIEKSISLQPGHTAIYSRHTISGMKGPMNLGHHAMLSLKAQRSARVSVSKFTYGQVFPQPFENPVEGGYSILKPGGSFQKINRVPRADGQRADLSVYPDREGYEDLVMMISDAKQSFAWTAVTVPAEGYVWFALKDPRVLRSTIFWMSNGGRHYAPWNSRHRGVIGLEEVTSYFHCGLAESAKPNPLNRRGIPTTVTLNPKRPLSVNYIMAVAAIPKGFDIVKSITGSRDGQSVTLTSGSGKTVKASVNLKFLHEQPE